MEFPFDEIRILCVDDEPGILAMYKRIFAPPQPALEHDVANRLQRRKLVGGDSRAMFLESQDREDHFILLSASNGEEAIEIAGREKALGNDIHIGFFDMIIPGGIDGATTIKAVLELQPEMHCAIVTAHTDFGMKKLSSLFPSQDQWLFLNKPFGKVELLQIARNLCSSWSLKRWSRMYADKLEQEVYQQTRKYQEVAGHLVVLGELSREISTASEYDQLFNRVMDELGAIINAQMGSLLLIQDENFLVVKGAAGPDFQRVLSLKNEIGQDRLSSKVLATKKPLLIREVATDDHVDLKSDQLRPICHSLICVPILVKGKAVGIVNFGATKERVPFTQAECDLVETLAGQLGMVIENSRLFSEIKESYNRLSHSYLLTVKALTRAIDAKDHYTFGHSNRVGKFTSILAKQLQVDKELMVNLEWACNLHDVGKIAISEAILNKPGRLDEEEFRVIQSHPGKGVEIIDDIPFLEKIYPIILHHHERFDGRGYPGKLGDREIPFGSRILAVADTYDAMTSDRPYRKGQSRKIAFDEIVRCSGSQFDPVVVEAFIECFKNGLL